MKQVRKIYDKTFKEKAVQLSYDRTNVSELARELGATAEKLYKWLKEFEEFPVGNLHRKENLKQIILPVQKRLPNNKIKNKNYLIPAFGILLIKNLKTIIIFKLLWCVSSF